MLAYGVLLAVVALSTAATTPRPSSTKTCPITPYTDVDLTKISGTWYAVRGIEHNSLKQTSRQRNNKACPVISLALTDETHIAFSYDSRNGSDPRHYNMTVRDPARPSYWTTEKGTKKHLPFSKLQINDVTDNTIALTMCSSQRLASVILSREKKFESDIVEAITQRLAAKGLNTNRSFDRCKP